MTTKRKITDVGFKPRKSTIPQPKLNCDGTLTLRFTYTPPNNKTQEETLVFDCKFSYFDDPQEYVHTLMMTSGDKSIFNLLTNGAKVNDEVVMKLPRGGSLQAWFRSDAEVIYNDGIDQADEYGVEYLVFAAGTPGRMSRRVGVDNLSEFICISVNSVEIVSVEFKPK